VWVLIAPKIQHLTILQGDDFFPPFKNAEKNWKWVEEGKPFGIFILIKLGKKMGGRRKTLWNFHFNKIGENDGWKNESPLEFSF